MTTYNTDTITCSFKVDRALYNKYKGVISTRGEYVKGDLVRHMYKVIENNELNKETLQAMEEVEDMINHPNKYKGYTDIDEMFEEILG